MGSRRSVFGIALAVCLSAGTAYAQINPAHLTGTVKDAQGAVLPGVSVTATSPALLGNQTVVTEANGDYRFPSLPAGTYALSFDLQGFQSLKRGGIVVTTGQTLTIDATLQIATLQESVTVTSEAPVVDTQSTAVGYVQTLAQLKGVPTSTDLWGALTQTPGIRMQGVDVGGSHKSQQSGYDAFGITNQARIVTDGVDTTEGSGGAGFYQDYYAQNEIAVGAAGQDVSMNTPGAAIISTVKSGGNNFSGLEGITYEPGSFVGKNWDAATAARGDPAGQPNLIFWEGHVELGGPILKDRLWFYDAFNRFKINKAVSGVPQNLATDLGLFRNFTSKESFKATSKDTFIGYYQWQYKTKPLRGVGITTPAESALAQHNPGWQYNGRWQRTWSNRLFSEVNIGEFGYIFPEQPNVPYTTFPPRHDLGTGADSGAGWQNAGGSTGPFILGRGKPQAYANLTYFLPTSKGSHDLKLGFEWMNDRSTNTANGTAGPILYLDRNGAANEVRLTDYGDPASFGSGWTQASDYDRHYTLYGQDRWTVTNRVTLSLGVRYDYQRPYYSTAKRVPLLTDVFPATTVPAASLLKTNNIAPRLGMSWDASGDGKSVVKAFYGRYYFNIADTLAGADPGGPNYKDIIFTDPNHNGLYDGTGELGAVVSSFGGASTTVDPNLKLAYADEIDLSYDRQFWGQSAVRVAYVRKMEKNLYTTINTPRIGQYTVPSDGERQAAGHGQRRHRAAGVHGVRHPELAQGRRAQRDHEHPGLARRLVLDVRHDGVRVQQALRRGALRELELRLPVAQGPPDAEREQQQPELGSDRHGRRRREHLLRAGVLGGGAAEDDGVGREGVGAVSVQVRHRRGGELLRPGRMAVRPHDQRVAAQLGEQHVLLAGPEQQPRGHHLGALAPPRQGDSDPARQGHGHIRPVQRAEHERRHQLQHRQRRALQPDQRHG